MQWIAPEIAIATTGRYTQTHRREGIDGMSGNVNRIRNSNFRQRHGRPTGWTWKASDRRIAWSGTSPRSNLSESGVTITSDAEAGEGHWFQTVVVKPDRYYRVEALVRCDLTAKDEWSGLVLGVEPGRAPSRAKRRASIFVSKSDRRSTPPVHRASSPVLIRAYFQAQADVRRLRVSVGIRDARGWACIHEVRVIEIIEPDEQSHILAMPPPGYAMPPPHVARRVCVCSQTAEVRPLTRILRSAFGARNVVVSEPDGFGSVCDVDVDAVFFPDARRPKSLRSLHQLLELSQERIVIVSLPAFAELAGAAVQMRLVKQPDDPTFAKVVYANHVTRGFALHDVFPFGEQGRNPGSFAQNHYRRSKAFEAFCRRHGFVTLLASMCNRDATSDQPICLYRAAAGGGLYVLDVQAAEQTPSTFNEPVLAMHLLLNLLGRSPAGLGQYVVPSPRGETIREFVREMSARIDEWVVHDEDVPSAEVEQQLVTLGREDHAFGLPLTPKPLILVRSGLRPGDVDSVYAAFVWFKQLVARSANECPYARALATRFRLAWLPFSALWESRDGWSRSSAFTKQTPPLDIVTDDAPVEGVVDLVSNFDHRIRVVIPREDGPYAHLVRWIPMLATAFRVTDCFSHTPDEHGSAFDRDAYAWRWVAPAVEVAVNESLVRQVTCRDSAGAVRHVVRIEVPAFDGDFAAQSIYRTHVAATLLEQVTGLMYGLIAVNRQASPVHLDGFAPIAPGQALIVNRDDPMLRTCRLEVG